MTPQLLLVLAVAAVGVLHTIVPDHWAPITLLARQRGWTIGQTARVAAVAGVGHTVSTLMLAVVVWIAGVAIATRFGHAVGLLSSAALIAFGGWIVVGAWRELRSETHRGRHDRGLPAGGVESKPSGRTALLLILGSSPMVEGIPAFFAAARFGVPLLAIMAVVFAVATIATYVGLCIASTAGLQRIGLGPLERYGEVLSGGFIAALGVVFLIFPGL